MFEYDESVLTNKTGEYYRKDLAKLYRFLVPKTAKALHLRKPYLGPKTKNEYLILDNLLGDTEDVQKFFLDIREYCQEDGRIVITYYNHLWEPILKLASFLGWRKTIKEQNWLDQQDIVNLLNLADFEVVNKGKRLLIPIEIPIISSFMNKWLAVLPVINELCLTTWVVARIRPIKRTEYSVSIVIPARNEEGNISRAVSSLPKFGKHQEVIFVEGHSSDETWEAIKKETKKKRKGLRALAFKQKGKGKADAVRLGFGKAKGELLMILDADLTVSPSDLPKFYEAIADGHGEFINGSRMAYPMESQAMRTLNKLGNKTFSWLFTWILGQRFKDTLCGTKVLLKKDYEKIVKNRSFFGDFDPFGDFDLIFGAVKQNLKVVEIPVRYKDRTYGSTNISRFKHGLLLLRMTWFAFIKFKGWV